jgi:glucosamine-6-phosphate deaminase
LMTVDKGELVRWCRVPAEELIGHPDVRIPVRICSDAKVMATLMARELVDAIRQAAEDGRGFRVIIPCGPRSWYLPFATLVNNEHISLFHVSVFHMDENLDWQGRLLPRSHPYSFRGFMEESFYKPIHPDLAVPVQQRHWLEPSKVDEIAGMLDERPADLAYGGWGQDGHVAYNQARRQPYSPVSLRELRSSTARVQENNADTIWALAQRELGGAYQFVPPMSVTLGMREIMGAKRIRLFSDTGAWKQTALRVALFSEPTPDYPITILQEHDDVLLTATKETAAHPISLHPEWEFGI